MIIIVIKKKNILLLNKYVSISCQLRWSFHGNLAQTSNATEQNFQA